VVRQLPETAWLRQNKFLDDHVNGGDAGLYDLVLNPRDRAFSVPALAVLVAEAGLTVTCWVEPLRYDPAAWVVDAKLRARFEALDPLARAAVAEALCGNINAHIVYCTRADAIPARPDPLAPNAVPVAREMPMEELAKHIGPDGTFAMWFDGLRAVIPLPAMAPVILRLIDGKRSVGEIAATLAERGVAPAAFERAWKATYFPLEKANRLLLAAPE
jgi:hypothetical protein